MSFINTILGKSELKDNRKQLESILDQNRGSASLGTLLHNPAEQYVSQPATSLLSSDLRKQAAAENLDNITVGAYNHVPSSTPIVSSNSTNTPQKK